MKKLFKFVAIVILSSLGVYFVYLGVSALIQGARYIEAIGCIVLALFGIGLILNAWAILRGHSTKDILEDLFTGLPL